MTHGVCGLIWVKMLMKDLGFSVNNPMNLFCNNKAAIDIAHNPMQIDRIKHTEGDRHFIKEKLSDKQICMSYVPSGNQLAEFLKGLLTKHSPLS